MIYKNFKSSISLALSITVILLVIPLLVMSSKDIYAAPYSSIATIRFENHLAKIKLEFHTNQTFIQNRQLLLKAKTAERKIILHSTQNRTRKNQLIQKLDLEIQQLTKEIQDFTKKNEILKQTYSVVNKQRELLQVKPTLSAKPTPSKTQTNSIQPVMRTLRQSTQSLQKFNQQSSQNNCPIIAQPKLQSITPPAHSAIPSVIDTGPPQKQLTEAETLALLKTLPPVITDTELSDEKLQALLVTLPSVSKTDPQVLQYRTLADTDFSIRLLEQLVPILSKLEKYPKDRFISSEQMRLVQTKNQLIQAINLERASNSSKILQQYVPKNTKNARPLTQKQKNTPRSIVTQANVDDIKQLEETLKRRKQDLVQETAKQSQLEQNRKELIQYSQKLNQAFQEQRTKTTNLTGLTQRYNERRTETEKKLLAIQKNIRMAEGSINGYNQEITELAKTIKLQTELFLLPTFGSTAKK